MADGQDSEQSSPLQSVPMTPEEQLWLLLLQCLPINLIPEWPTPARKREVHRELALYRLNVERETWEQAAKYLEFHENFLHGGCRECQMIRDREGTYIEEFRRRSQMRKEANA